MQPQQKVCLHYIKILSSPSYKAAVVGCSFSCCPSQRSPRRKERKKLEKNGTGTSATGYWVDEVNERWRVVMSVTGRWRALCKQTPLPTSSERKLSFFFLLVYPPFLPFLLFLFRLSEVRHQRQVAHKVVPSSQALQKYEEQDREHLPSAAMATAKHLVPLIGSCIWIHTVRTQTETYTQERVQILFRRQPLKWHSVSRKIFEQLTCLVRPFSWCEKKLEN